MQRAVVIDVDIQRFEVSRSVDKPNISGLDKIVSDYNVLLIRRDFDVVRTDTGLNFIGVVQTLDVGEIRDV